MGDVGADDVAYQVKKLEHQRKQIELNVSSSELQILEAKATIARAKENLTASVGAIEDIDQQITKLKESDG